MPTNKTDNEFKLTHKEIMNDTLSEHLIIEALTAAMTHTELSQFLTDINWDDKSEIECYIVIEGHKFPIKKVVEHWEQQMDQQIKKKAIELLDDKFRVLQDFAHDLANGVKEKAANELGITITMEEW